jgi:hypothetical protein
MLDQLEAALAATKLPFAFASWSEAPEGDYGVYTPDGANDLEADDEHAERAISGTVDYFVRGKGATEVALIETALDSVEGLAWRMESVQYESDSGYLHVEWSFEAA